ncbi:YjbH domain-containing protein [Anaerolineae bacterium CFX9]|nr:YjbH domain-containing protein [Anaerolineae bacterium CFX9]
MTEPDRGGCAVSMSMLASLLTALFLGFFTVSQSSQPPPIGVPPMMSFEVIYETPDPAALENNRDAVIPAVVHAFRERGYHVVQIRVQAGRLYVEAAGAVDQINTVAAEIAAPGVIPLVELTFASIGVLE